MKTFFPENTSSRDLHHIMLGTVIPRPIAFVSTIDSKGIKNLAPFSYFNAVSSLPPKMMFSISRKSDGSKKDTLINVENTGECVINMVSQDMAKQMTIAGFAFDHDVDEFSKSGLHPVKSESIKTPGVLESPVRYECKLNRIIELGDKPGECSIVLCDVVCIHIDENIMEDNKIKPEKTNIIGRLGSTEYLKINKENIFSALQNRKTVPVGFDNLPKSILQSKILTGNEIAEIAGLNTLPSKKEIETNHSFFKQFDLDTLHFFAQMEIMEGNIRQAANILMAGEYLL
ncbi:MAG TPA: flavin reductase family protein [Bacteroidetes bacterium]|nr:flavin reductase family protein [Bacteroidota bacterium]